MNPKLFPTVLIVPKLTHRGNNMKKSISVRFNKFHRENPHVWEEFKRIGLWAVNVCERKGIKYLSADLIANQMRWQSFISTSDKDFKINNNFTSTYSRMFQDAFPEHRHLFRNRRTQIEKAEATFY